LPNRLCSQKTIKSLLSKFLLPLSFYLGLSTAFGETPEELYNRDDYKAHRQYNLTMDDRFETTLFASPPYVEYVTAVSADLDGTLYTSVDPNGSLGHIEGIGKIVTAKDTDGDGKADVFKDFVPYVASPRGGHYVAGTFYLLHPPFLSTFKDTDGDGVSNQKKTLMKGFGGGIEHPRGADHTTNGVRMGIDGWLYVSVGDFGMTDVKDTDGKIVRLFGGGVARVRPDGTELEVYVYNTRNQFDVAISPTLELFTRDNTNDGKGWNLRVHHQVPESDFGYPRLYQNFPDEHLASLADYGGGSGMGCLYLDEPGFPKEINDRLYTCDWTSGKLFGFNMIQKDATYKIEQTVLTNLERATDVDVDGRSNLYLADWKGGRFKFENGKPVSRIHMARLKGYKAPPAPVLDSADEATLIQHLLSDSASIRLQAQQYLIQKGLSSTGAQKLETEAKNPKLHLYKRIAVLFALKQIQGEASHDLCKALLNDSNMKRFALKALTDRKTQLSNVSPDLIARYLSDADPKVRLQAAISLRRLNKYSPSATDKLIKMATASWKEDSVGKLGAMALPHLASRALSGLGQNHEAAWQQYLKAFKSGDLKTQKALSYALKTIHEPKLIQALIDQLGLEKWTDESRLLILDILARLSHKEKEWDLTHWWGTRPHDDGPYYETVEWEYTQPIIQAIEKSFNRFSGEAQLKVLEKVSLNQINPSSLKLEGVDTLFAALESEVPSQQHIQVLKGTATNSQREWTVRTKAARKLFDFQEWQDPKAIQFKRNKKKKETKRIVDEKKLKFSKDMRNVASKSLLEVLSQWQAALQQNKVPVDAIPVLSGILLDYWTAPISRPEDLPNLVKTANTVDDEAATLAWKKLFFAFYRNIGKRQLQVEKLIDSKDALHNAGYYKAVAEMYLLDKKFAERAKSVLNWDYKGVRDGAAAVLAMHEKKATLDKDAAKGISVATAMDKAADYAQQNKGDIELGKKLFNRQGCIACHAISNAGLQKGPFMGSAGSQFERKFLIESVLNPMAAIAQGFPTYMLTPKPGRGENMMGFLVSEDNTNYYLMNSAGFYFTAIKEHMAKKEIIPTSQMPPGLVFNLNMHEFTSLIEYLVSMK
jgi:putative heme-binding domain-containing protein